MTNAINAAKARLAASAAATNQNAATTPDGAGAAGQNNMAAAAQGDGVSAVTPAAAGNMGEHLGQLGTAPTSSIERAAARQESKEVAVAKLKNARTYLHIFAGAGTNMPNGKRLNFNGRPGGQGYYTTTKQEEIDFLEDLADSVGSQVSRDERELLIDNALVAEQEQAYADSTVNSARQLDAGVVAAQDNLARTIAATSGQ